MPKIQKDKTTPKCSSCKTYFEPAIKKNGEYFKCCFKCRTHTVYYKPNSSLDNLPPST